MSCRLHVNVAPPMELRLADPQAISPACYSVVIILSTFAHISLFIYYFVFVCLFALLMQVWFVLFELLLVSESQPCLQTPRK